jgi:4-alpha-glucanotransferase
VQRVWGFGVNVYALRSARNWGIGDFGDLRVLIEQAARLGAGIVGVNPLHALRWTDPEAASPYMPVSRFFLNPMYIDVEAVPEYASDATTRALVQSAAFRDELERARASPTVRYDLVGACKRRALERLYAAFCRTAPVERQRAFGRFTMRDPLRLQRFARYEALSEHFSGDRARRAWPMWPEALRDPANDAVERFASDAHQRAGFFAYLQFVADEQLAAAAEATDGMAIGLYRDLALSVGFDSADVWSDPAHYDADHTIGAPPDALGPLGQNWDLAPLDPAALEREDGATFAALLRANMRHAGALRIDHVMSLERLFWIPRGSPPSAGRYVAYPFERLRAIVARESASAGCLVVGEDLGTVPDGFREAMRRDAILSYRVLLLERDAIGAFHAPGEYPSNALATATTHDLPTLTGWVLGRDLDARLAAGLIDEDEARAGRNLRRVHAMRLLEALYAAGELADALVEPLFQAFDARRTERDVYAPLIAAAYRFLARTPARIVILPLDDACGELDQVNVPGTIDEYPNWRRKNSVAVEALALDERIANLAAELNSILRGGSST